MGRGERAVRKDLGKCKNTSCVSPLLSHFRLPPLFRLQNFKHCCVFSPYYLLTLPTLLELPGALSSPTFHTCPAPLGFWHQILHPPPRNIRVSMGNRKKLQMKCEENLPLVAAGNGLAKLSTYSASYFSGKRKILNVRYVPTILNLLICRQLLTGKDFWDNP